MDYAFLEEIYDDDGVQNKKEYNPNLLDSIIWIFISVFCGITSNLNCDGTGLYIQITVHDFLLTFIATLILLVGLKKNTPICIVPWLVVSFWNMLACQYFSFEEITSSIFYADLDRSPVGTFLLLTGIASLGLRVYLWKRIFELTYFNKYEPKKNADDYCCDKHSEMGDSESQFIEDLLNEVDSQQVDIDESNLPDAEIIETIYS